MQGGGGGVGEGERQGQDLNPGKPVFFSSLSFPNYLSCVLNCNDLLERSVISSPRSSTEVTVAFFLSNLLLFDVLHLLFIRQYMVMIGCTHNQWMCVCFLFVALWLLGYVHFKPPSRLVKFS